MKNLKRNTFLSIIGLVLAASFFTFCRKKENVVTSSFPGGGAVTNSFMNFSVSGVTYDAQLGMLQFNSSMIYKEAIDNLLQEQKNFTLDNGLTEELMDALQLNSNDEEVCDLLLANSPLSEAVMYKFMRRSLPEERFISVMAANLHYSNKTDSDYVKMNLSQEVKDQVYELYASLSPFHPGSTPFEAQFPGYISYRKFTMEAEKDFLLAGGDPAESNNPMNSDIIDRIDGTFYNKDLEVKIAGDIIKKLPGMNVIIKNNSTSILNYIRSNGVVPKATIPLSEPNNGIPLAQAPPYVDSNIEVQQTNAMNTSVGEVQVFMTYNNNGSVTFKTNVNDPNFVTYWNFGDGFASYRNEPTHTFSGITGEISPTAYIYHKASGALLGKGTALISRNQSGCGNIELMISKHPLSNHVVNLVINFSITNYNNTAVPFIINWGDNSSPLTGNYTTQGYHIYTHTYPGNFTYPINVSIGSATQYPFCTLTKQGNASFGPINWPWTPGGGGTTPVCCDKRDRDKEFWKFIGSDKKFRHKIRLSNVAGFGGKISTDLNTYHKVGPNFSSIWLPLYVAPSSACVSLSGKYYKGNSNEESPCAANKTQWSIGTPQNNYSPLYDCTWGASKSNVHSEGDTKFYYLTYLQAMSTASWHSQGSTLYISNCQ